MIATSQICSSGDVSRGTVDLGSAKRESGMMEEPAARAVMRHELHKLELLIADMASELDGAVIKSSAENLTRFEQVIDEMTEKQQDIVDLIPRCM